ncbi:MAG TPA: hypothetical protein VHZ54_10460 [Solirubrobacterales bacterium]|jgi:hypothetical protein|nr:hypothetical protein [Solirubrobacterales bacterium]
MAIQITTPTPVGDPLTFRDLLARMSAEERLRAYRAGAFTRAERTAWAARYPEEVPLVDDEFEWIALSLADLARGRPLALSTPSKGGDR